MNGKQRYTMGLMMTVLTLLLAACTTVQSPKPVSIRLDDDTKQKAEPLTALARRTCSTWDKVLRWGPELDNGMLVTTSFDKSKNQARQGFSFTCDQDVNVYAVAPGTGVPQASPGWKKVDVVFKSKIGSSFNHEAVFLKTFRKGERVVIPGNQSKTKHRFDIPFAAVVLPATSPLPPPMAPIHSLSTGTTLTTLQNYIRRSSDFGHFYEIPQELQGLPCIIPETQKGRQREDPGYAYTFFLEKPATVYLLVHSYGDQVNPRNPWGQLRKPWQRAYLRTYWAEPKGGWANDYAFDRIYKRDVPPGWVTIPANTSNVFDKGKEPRYDRRIYGLPHMAVIRFK